MIPIEIEIKDDVLNVLCPFCGKNLIRDICKHLLLRHDIIAGGYTYIQDGLDSIKESEFSITNSYPFEEDDLIFKIRDDELGNMVHIIVRK